MKYNNKYWKKYPSILLLDIDIFRGYRRKTESCERDIVVASYVLVRQKISHTREQPTKKTVRNGRLAVCSSNMAAATSVVVLDRGNNTTCTINLHGECGAEGVGDVEKVCGTGECKNLAAGGSDWGFGGRNRQPRPDSCPFGWGAAAAFSIKTLLRFFMFWQR